MDTTACTDRAKLAISLAMKSAHEKGQEEVSPEELLEGLFNVYDISPGVGLEALKRTGNDIVKIKDLLGYGSVTEEEFSAFMGKGRCVPLSQWVEKIVVSAVDEVGKVSEVGGINQQYVGTEHLTLALLNSRKLGEDRMELLESRGITYESVFENVQIVSGMKADPAKVNLYKSLDTLIQGGDFEGANAQLQSLGVDSLSTSELLDCLLATRGHTDKLRHRSEFYQGAKDQITNRGDYQGSNVKLLELLRE